MPIGVLLVEDSFLDQELFRFQFNHFKGKDQFQLGVVESLAEAIQELQRGNVEVVMLDLNLMDSQGLETLRVLKERFPQLAFVVIAGTDDEEQALEALKSGAQDYVVKGQLEPSALGRAMMYALERKRSTELFLAQELRYKNIFENSIDAIFIFSPKEHRIKDCNKAMLSLLGADKKSLVGSRITHYFREVNQLYPYLMSLKEMGQLSDYEVQLIALDGRLVDVLISVVAMKNREGEIISYQGLVRDITELKQSQERLKEMNEHLSDLVRERTKELESQKFMVDAKNLLLGQSISYAKRIQQAILPRFDRLQKRFPEAFLIYKPKDVVSGDFYWFHSFGDKDIVVVGDCTGHGVPGAFMSLIGVQQLEQVVVGEGICDPKKILERLHKGINRLLNNGGTEEEGVGVLGGMDVAICLVDRENHFIEFAGAMRPMVVIREGMATKIRGSRRPIGGIYYDEAEIPFVSEKFLIEKGDMVYLFSDGFADQFGGPKGKKFMSRQFNLLLSEVSKQTTAIQAQKLEHVFEEWRGPFEQLDDLCVVGLRI